MTLWRGPMGGGQFRPDLDPQKNFFLLNFTRILRLFWNLGLTFDVLKDVVFAEILVFSNIFAFPAVNWVRKWAKTVNFGCIPFEPKCKF